MQQKESSTSLIATQFLRSALANDTRLSAKNKWEKAGPPPFEGRWQRTNGEHKQVEGRRQKTLVQDKFHFLLYGCL